MLLIFYFIVVLHCCVQVIEKLSARTPNAETKIKILSMIAQEYNVKWDPAASKEQILKPREDLLVIEF